MLSIGKPSDNQGISKCINLSAPLSGDITRWKPIEAYLPRYHLYTYLLPFSLEDHSVPHSQLIMEPIHHVTTSSKVLFTKVRKMVPPMLEKFHKGLSS
jgi:hypothetical protein